MLTAARATATATATFDCGCCCCCAGWLTGLRWDVVMRGMEGKSRRGQVVE